jgi:hypothetical protein
MYNVPPQQSYMEEHFVQGRRYLKPDPNLFGYKVATGRAWPITSDEWTLYKDLQSVPNHSQKMSKPEQVVKEGFSKHVTSFFLLLNSFCQHFSSRLCRPENMMTTIGLSNHDIY